MKGSASIVIQSFDRLEKEVTADLTTSAGFQYQMQVYPDDFNLNVYFCVRPDAATGDQVLIADADSVILSVTDIDTKQQRCLSRTGVIARPSGDRFRDYMAVFPFSLLAKSALVTEDGTVCFSADFDVQLVAAQFADPDWDRSDVRTASDIRIIAGDEPSAGTFFAHKAVLSKSSVYFKNLFQDCEATCQVNSQRLEVCLQLECTSWTALLTLMRYSYRKEICVSQKDWKQVISAASRYEYYAVMFGIGSLLTTDNVFDVRGYCDQIREGPLADMCQEFVRKNLNHFLQPERFVMLTAEQIAMILSDPRLPVEQEISLWNLCEKWVEAEIQRKGCGRSVDQKRKLMKPFLLEFRFPAMSFQEFTAGPANSHILNMKELSDVLNNMCCNRACEIFWELRVGQVKKKMMDYKQLQEQEKKDMKPEKKQKKKKVKKKENRPEDSSSSSSGV